MLDPIHFGFTASLLRYAELRRRKPDVEILMGTGNLTELTDADSAGVTAVLLGICSELGIRNMLAVQVSPHTRRTIEEHDAARRLMFAAPRGPEPAEGLRQHAARRCTTRSRFRVTPEEIAALAREVRDRNFRIEAAADGIHIYNRDGHHVAQRCAVALSEARRGERRRARLLSRHRADEGGDRASASASAMRRTSRSTGASPPTARRRTARGLPKAGHTLRAKKGG